MSIFNLETFMTDSITEEASETKATLLPAGEYEAVIRKLDIKETQSGSIMLTIRWFPTIPNDLAATLKLDPERAFTIPQRVFLDIDEDTGKLAKGTNVNLGIGRIRDAVGQNTPGPWSVSNLEATRAKVRVVQVLAYNDPTRMLNEVTNVVKL